MQSKTALGQESPENATARARIRRLEVAAMVVVLAYSFRGGIRRYLNFRLQRRGFHEATRRMQNSLVEDCGSWRLPKNLAVESPAHSLSCGNAECLLPNHASMRVLDTYRSSGFRQEARAFLE